MLQPADLIDVFAARATPRARRERPALFAARMAWATIRVAAERGCVTPPPLGVVGGLGLGDRVHIELAPSLWWRGEIVEWVREPLPGAQAPVSVASVRLDCWPPGVTPPVGFEGGGLVRRRRNRLAHITESLTGRP